MEEQITKEKAKELMKLKGEVRGLALKSHKEFILKEKGPEGLRRLEEFLEKLEIPAEYRKAIEPMTFYPVGLEIIELLAIKEIFGFGKEKFKEIGAFSSKLSLILRVFMKYFVSLEMVIRQAPEIWRKYYTIGELEIADYNREERSLTIRIKDLHLHYLHCLHLVGYISNVVKMVVKSPVRCSEKKCIYSGDPYHEFLVEW